MELKLTEKKPWTLWLSATVISALLTAPVAARTLTQAFLTGNKSMASPVDSSEYAAGTEPANSQFEGLLEFKSSRSRARMKVLKDTFGTARNKKLRLKELPDFTLALVQHGQALIPFIRTPQRTRHPYWEFIAGTGSAWHELADGDWNRAAIPFALKEANQNCLHNGLLMFLFKADGHISNIAYQVSSETCSYLHINLWGLAKARYVPEKLAGSDQVVSVYLKERANRLPVQPIGRLAGRFPGFDPGKLIPPAADDITVYGVVTGNVHYRSNCPTRFGPYPYCDEIALPSYSLAKSVFAGLAYMMIVRQWPEFEHLSIAHLVPACRLRDGRWHDVTPRDLINMTSGNYRNGDFPEDEDSAVMTQFFLAYSHKEKLHLSCSSWPRRQQPGERLVYHTTDDYLLGVAMTTFLRTKSGPQADIFHDLIDKEIFSPLGLSQLSRAAQRTYDQAAQPFTAYGLFFQPDDIARLGKFLVTEKNTRQLFRTEDIERAMFKNTSGLLHWHYSSNEAYALGFWGFDIAPFLACKKATWIPFMSGYGGIIVALLPNDVVYYYFTDGGHGSWKDAVVEINLINKICAE